MSDVDDLSILIDFLRDGWGESADEIRGNYGEDTDQGLSLLEQFCSENNTTADEFLEDGIEEFLYEIHNSPKRTYREPKNYTYTFRGTPIEVVEKFGGEGRGEQYYYILSYGLYFLRVGGYYDSWQGTTWSEEETEIVVPKPVTVIEWVKFDG